jgi:hypothetical protein
MHTTDKDVNEYFVIENNVIYYLFDILVLVTFILFEYFSMTAMNIIYAF